LVSTPQDTAQQKVKKVQTQDILVAKDYREF
jgi:hypothetical protein